MANKFEFKAELKLRGIVPMDGWYFNGSMGNFY